MRKLNRVGSSLGRLRNWLVAAGIVLIAGGGAVYYFFHVIPTANAQAAAEEENYQTTTVRRSDLRTSIDGSGTLVASKSVDLSFSSSGQVAEVNVSLGEAVSEGQELALLGNTESLQASLASAHLQLLQVQQSLADLQANADLSLAQAYQAYIQAKSDYSVAQSEAQRMSFSRCSQEKNTQNKVTLEHATERLNKAEEGSAEWVDLKNQYDTALANYNYCLAYTTDEKTAAEANLVVAERTLQQAEQTYSTLKDAAGIDPDQLALLEAEVEAAQTAQAKAQQALDGSVLISPIDGTVTYLAASAGTIVGTDKFITISVLSQPVVDIQVDESDLGMFTVGSRVEVVFDALPDQVFTGTIVQVDPALSTTMMVTTVQGQVELDSERAGIIEKLPLGLNASVEIIHQEVQDALVIPIEALRDLGDGEYAVFVVGADGQLRLRTVETGVMDTAFVEITSGLSEGEIVSTGLVATSQQ